MNKYDRIVEIFFRLVIGIELVLIIALIIMNTTTNKNVQRQKSFYENRQVNELIPVSPNDDLIVKKYFSDFVSLVINAPNVAYDYVAPYYKEKVYPSLEYFEKNILKDVTDGFKTSSIKTYKVTDKNKYRVFYIKDTSNHEYLIKEEGIMNYKIYLDVNITDI